MVYFSFLEQYDYIKIGSFPDWNIYYPYYVKYNTWDH